jgi:type 1 glutamine amidotransferase
MQQSRRVVPFALAAVCAAALVLVVLRITVRGEASSPPQPSQASSRSAQAPPATSRSQPPAAPSAAPGAPAQPDTSKPQPSQSSRKRILVIGAATGYQHDSITDAMTMVWKMGRETGMWEAFLRTDCEWITKKKPDRNAKNLDAFDAIVLANSTGEMPLDDEQKKAFLAFVHDEGKGLVGIHAALDANYKWPEYGEMIGGWFDAHPWNTFYAPILVEDPQFPAVRHFPPAFTRRDEIYQAKQWSRDKVNVLLRLDETKLVYENNPNIKRTDRDFAVAWSKMYGKGRVFYSTLGHTQESFYDPDIQKMFFEAIKWVLGLTEGSTASHPKPAKPTS